MAATGTGTRGLLLRLLFPVLLCLATYNSTRFNLVGLLSTGLADQPLITALIVVVWLGLFALLCWILQSALGWIGIAFLVIVCGLLIAIAWDWSMLDGENVAVWQNLLPILLGLILGIGLISSFLYRRLTGRVPTEDPDT